MAPTVALKTNRPAAGEIPDLVESFTITTRNY
jgi:hypothetical protein